MTRIDLKTDDGLKAACAKVRSRIDRKQVSEVAALLQEIRNASETRRAALDFQVRVWDDTKLWWGGLMVRRGISAKIFLEKDGIHTWFGQQTGLKLPADRKQRVERLTALCHELILKKIKEAVDWEPWVETLRTLALFFPEDFTALADPAKVVPLAHAMGFSASRRQIVRAHRRILDRLQEILGSAADGIEGRVERMLLPTHLYRLLYPKLWVVRAGAEGRDEDYVLSNETAMLGFEEEPEPNTDSYEDYRQIVRRAHKDWSNQKATATASQVWNFGWKIRPGDIVVLPQMKGDRNVAWGTVEGRYEYRDAKEGVRHTLPVKWVRTDIPKMRFGEDRKYLDRPGTVFSLQKHADRLLPVLGVTRSGGTPLRPLPAAQRSRTLPTGPGNGFESLKAVLARIGDGAPFDDLIRQMQEQHEWDERRASWYLSAIRKAFGVFEHHDGTARPTEIGRELQRTGEPDALRDRLLTESLGYDHLVVWLDESTRDRKWLLSELGEINPGWTTPAIPSALLRWLQLLDLAHEGAERVFRLTERGRDWRSRVHWEPERLETSARSPFEAVWTPLSESAGKEKLRFDRSLVEALHLGLWADSQRHFAVLSGLSGTGKTQIALRYAMALTGAESDTGGPVEVISVHPGWHDPGPLLGYVNPLTGNYTRTEFLNFLLDAGKNPGQPHVLILDEMNLSHPEQYFAPILSAMEIRDGEIPLHREDAKKLGVPTGVAYPSNLVIIGTVNMDETTMGISDKVLDRAFTLEFWDIDPEEWPGWDGCSLGEAEKSKVRGLLVELTKALAPARRHFGWRVIKEVVGFLEGRSRDTGVELTAKDALDQVIYAKVLPKLRGSDTGRFRDCLDATLAVLEKHGLRRCAEKVKALSEDLEATGSCSFWR